jgi:hypothetical protein
MRPGRLVRVLSLAWLLSWAAFVAGYADVTPPWSTTFDCPDWTDSANGSYPGFGGTMLVGRNQAVHGTRDHYSCVTVDANNPLGSGKGFRSWSDDGIPAKIGAHSAQVAVRVSNPSNQAMWIRYYHRWQLGATLKGGNPFIKMLYRGRNLIEMDRGGIRYLNPGREVANFRAGGWNDIFPGGASDGRFHSFQYHFDPSTGTFTYWVDGVKKGSASGLTLPDTFDGLFQLRVNHHGYSNGDYIYEDTDDIAVSLTGYIPELTRAREDAESGRSPTRVTPLVTWRGHP